MTHGPRVHGTLAAALVLAAGPGALATPSESSRRAPAAVRAWEATETIPTYEEGPPEVNPPFDLFAGGRFNYPYTMRLDLTDRRAPRVWRTLNLENEHLRVSVLPDLGGRLWRCVDKANGAQMFYANPSLKFAQVAYRGSWATFGIEFNFPVSHNWVTSSPVDHALVTNRDGSASIVVGNIDLVYGMQWRVELTLRPGRSVLEQATTLYNRSDLRHRFYWWTNAAVEAWDDSHILYPMEFTASHAFTQVDTWPIDSKGVDLSRPGNHLNGAVSLFSHGSREPFMGIYHPRTRAGVVHYADFAELPAKKVWSWGADAEGIDWRRALSDNVSAEVEVQAGLFRNQETYAFLEPQESIRFRESWMPVREMGGFSRANPDAIVHVTREGGGAQDPLKVGVQVTRALARGRLRIKEGERTIAERVLDLTPAQVFQQSFPALARDTRYTVEVVDPAGRVVIAHTEGRYDLVPRDEVKVGPQRLPVPPPPESRGASDFEDVGRSQELDGKLLRAWDTYEDGLRRFPESAPLLKASGRLAVALKRFDEAVARLRSVLERVSNDPEAHYALGCAYAALGDDKRARAAWEGAAYARRTRPAALLQLGRAAARAGDRGEAIRLLRVATEEEPLMIRGGGLEVALLRRSGRGAEARKRLAHWYERDPTSSFLRHEAVMLGGEDAALWRHLAGDPQRVLEIAVDYMEIGANDDALGLLERTYPEGPGVYSEPGMPPPQRHPEVAYYRGYCRERLGQSGREDFKSAASLSTTYVFPQRAQTLPVLKKALEADPGDATARFLLGSLYLSGGREKEAIAEWQEARRRNPRQPVLHRNLALALVHAGELEAAREVLDEGLAADPRNVEVYQAADQVLGLLDRPPGERVAALERYPDAALPTALVFTRIVALVEAGRFDDAERLFSGRFFPREEFGTNVRQLYVEVKLQKALALARAGRKPEAMALATSLQAPVPGLEFTKDGMGPFVEGARTQYLVGQVFSLCGDERTARAHWEAAARGVDSYPAPEAAFAFVAGKRADLGDEAERRARLEAALQSWAGRLVAGTNFPGANAVGQGYFLLALGREADARPKLREALLLPDKRMSHYLSRRALAPDGPW